MAAAIAAAMAALYAPSPACRPVSRVDLSGAIAQQRVACAVEGVVIHCARG